MRQRMYQRAWDQNQPRKEFRKRKKDFASLQHHWPFFATVIGLLLLPLQAFDSFLDALRFISGVSILAFAIGYAGFRKGIDSSSATSIMSPEQMRRSIKLVHQKR